jgi:hypothetical protein
VLPPSAATWIEKNVFEAARAVQTRMKPAKKTPRPGARRISPAPRKRLTERLSPRRRRVAVTTTVAKRQGR